MQRVVAGGRYRGRPALPDGTTITNSTTINAASDTNAANDTATEDTDIIAVTDLRVSKASSIKPFQPGRPLTYTISVLDAGPSDATDVVLSDPLPTGFSAVSAATDSGATCSSNVDHTCHKCDNNC